MRGSGNRIELGMEALRQAHQGTLHVERDVFSQRVDDWIFAVHPPHQALQVRQDFNDDVASGCAHQRRIANELNRISRALLAINQDAASFKRLAVP